MICAVLKIPEIFWLVPFFLTISLNPFHLSFSNLFFFFVFGFSHLRYFKFMMFKQTTVEAITYVLKSELSFGRCVAHMAVRLRTETYLRFTLHVFGVVVV